MNHRQTRRRICSAVEKLETRRLLSTALDNAGAISLAFGAAGVVHAAYYDSAQHDLMYATRDAGGAWSAAATIDAGPNVGSRLSLALDRAGQPGVAYYDAAHGDLKYAHLSAGGAWTIAVVNSRGDVGRNPQLAFDAADYPIISYYDSSRKSLRLATMAANHFRISTLASGSSAPQVSSIASAANGTFVVAYEAPAKHQVRIATGTAGHVHQCTVAKLTSHSLITPSAAFDASGKLEVCYVDPTDGSIVLEQPAKRSWTGSTLVNGAADFHQTPQLRFTAGTTQPQVLFADLAGNVCVASNASGVWTSTPTGTGILANSAFDPASGGVAIASSSAFVDINTTLAAPANVVATAASDGEIDLSWSESAASATGYIVQRAVGSGGAFADIATLGDVSTFADTTVTDGRSYTYRLCAVALGASSASSAVASAVTPSGAPTNFVAGMSFDWAPWIELNWTDNAVNETGYRIERASDGTHFATIDVLAPNSTDYLDTVVPDEQTFTYRVTPFNAAGDLTPSSAQSVTTGVAGPTDFQAIVASAGQVNLSWTNVSTSADHLEIDCMVNGVNEIVDANVPTTAHAYNVTALADGSSLVANTSYTFYVVAYRGNDTGASNTADCVTGFASPPKLEVSSAGSNQLTLTWGDVLGESGYEIQWSPDNTNFTTLTTTAADVTQYTVTGLTENTTYHFRIRAKSAGGDSAFLWYASPTTTLAAPINVTATAVAGDTIRLDWTNVSAVAQSYQISIAQGNGPFGNSFTVAADNTSALLTASATGALQTGLSYRVQIVAMASGNQSDAVTTAPIVAID